MALALPSFFGVITDRRIGAAYCTLLHSRSNFGTIDIRSTTLTLCFSVGLYIEHANGHGQVNSEDVDELVMYGDQLEPSQICVNQPQCKRHSGH